MVLKTCLFACSLLLQTFTNLWVRNNVECPFWFVLEVFTELASNLCEHWCKPAWGPCVPSIFFSLFSFLGMRNVRMFQNGPIAEAADEGRFLFWGPSSLLKLLLFINLSPGFGVGQEPLLQKVIQWAAGQPDHLVVLEVGGMRKIYGSGPLCGIAPALYCRTFVHACTWTCRLRETELVGCESTILEHNTLTLRNMKSLHQALCMVPLYFPTPNLSGGRNRKYNTINLSNSYFCNWDRVVRDGKKLLLLRIVHIKNSLSSSLMSEVWGLNLYVLMDIPPSFYSWCCL